MPACACRHRRRRATFCTTTAFCWRHNNLVTTTSSQRPRRDHSMRVSSLSRSHFYAPTQAWRRRWRRATYSTTFFCAGVTTTSSQQPRHNDLDETTRCASAVCLDHISTRQRKRGDVDGDAQHTQQQFSVLASQQPRHNDHVTTTSESRAASYANSTTHKSMYSRLRPNAMAATTARPTILLASLRMHACLQQPTSMCSANGGMGG